MGAQIRKVQLGLSTFELPEGESTQPPEDDPWTPQGAVEPPLNLDYLAGLTTVARIRRSCIAAIVQNTVGLGFTLRVRDGRQEDVADVEADTRAAVARLNALSQRDTKLKRPTFTRQMKAVEWDKYEVGNGYLEVSRNEVTGEIDGLFHLPGKRVRRRKNGEGWLFLNKMGGTFTDATTYYDFGTKVRYDKDGRPTGTLANSGRRWATNELIAFQLYTSESREYGLPPDNQLAGDYLGDKLAGETNIGFFDSKGVPPTVIFVQGKEVDEGEVVEIEVPPEYVKQITDTLRGAGQARRKVAVIGVPSGFQAQVENLAVLSDRDMGYLQYRADNRRAALAAFRLSPVFVADIEDAGRYTAEVERAITKEQVFDPEQQETEEILDFSLIGELFPTLALKFDEMRIAGDEVQRASADSMAGIGRITNGEYREAHGYPPLPEAQPGAEPEDGQVEAGWNRRLVPPGLGIHGGGVGGPRQVEPPPDETAAGSRLIAKGSDVEGELASGVAAEFDAAVEEAIRLINDQTGKMPVPVVVEKQGDSIVVAPYSSNGAGG